MKWHQIFNESNGMLSKESVWHVLSVEQIMIFFDNFTKRKSLSSSFLLKSIELFAHVTLTKFGSIDREICSVSDFSKKGIHKSDSGRQTCQLFDELNVFLFLHFPSFTQEAFVVTRFRF